MPMAVPTMPDSASGVSMMRSSPKSFCRFSVTRKTPPSLPMSSPMMTILGSRSMAGRRPALMALPMVIFDMSVFSLKARGVGSEPGTLGLGHGIHGQNVVAGHPHTGEAEATGPLVERDPGLSLDRLGDGPLVVLAEEDDRRVRGCRVDEGLVDVSLSAGTITKVGDDGCVPVWVAVADGVVVLDAHRVANSVQSLSPDDDGVEVEVVLVRVPPPVVDPAEQPQQVQGVDSAAPGDSMLAVGREGVVLRTEGAAGPDLCCLLPEQAGPQTELTLALEGRGLGIEPANQHLVAVEATQVIVSEVGD